MLAKNIYDYLRSGRAYDVFMDVYSLEAGEFEEIILEEIGRRTYFVIVLTVGSLSRMRDETDWLRRELATALAAQRIVVPVLDVGFDFDSTEVQEDLLMIPENLRRIQGFNAVPVPRPEYFDGFLKRLLTFLKEKPETLLPSPEVSTKLEEARQQLDALDVPRRESLALQELKSSSWQELQARILDNPRDQHTDPGGRASPQSGHTETLGSRRVGTISSRPTLRTGPSRYRLAWTPVIEARSYVLQRGADPGFHNPSTVYDGSNTSYFAWSELMSRTSGSYYRVKAIAIDGLSESEWSNVVATGASIEQTGSLSDMLVSHVAAPELSSAAYGVSWTSVLGASEYVVETAKDQLFTAPKTFRAIEAASFFMISPSRTMRLYVRVKAISGGHTPRESPWSNVVVVGDPTAHPTSPPGEASPDS